MTEPKISVIIPFYNRVNWLLEAVDSVLQQTRNDFEIIMVDDGSTEDVCLLSRYNDSRIFYIRQDNKGPAEARNNGIKHARGKYIAFLDADDLFLPDKLEVQYQYMEQHPEVLLTHTSYQRIDNQGVVISGQHSGLYTYKHYTDLMVSCPIATPTVMVRGDVLRSFDIKFPSGIHVGEDILFWIEIAKTGKIVGIDKVLASVRMHGSNATDNLPEGIKARKLLMDIALIPDEGISGFKKCVIKSKLWQSMARSYFTNSDWPNASRHVLYAIRDCPFRLGAVITDVAGGVMKSLAKRISGKKTRRKLQKSR